MRRVRCHECGKRYNYDVDDFCPRCGAFTQPSKILDIGVDGSVVRLEGINEENHRDSFVHAELHEENRKRRGTKLEADEMARRRARTVSSQPVRQSRKEAGKKNPVALIVWIIFAVIALNILSQIFYIFL